MIVGEKKIASIWPRMFYNIDYDHLEFIIITSQAKGRERSDGRPFGEGKSTLAIWMAYRCFAYANGTLYIKNNEIVDTNSYDDMIDLMEHVVRKFVKWRLDDIIETIKSERFIPALVWDDVQQDMPAYQHVPKDKRDKVEWLTRTRQRLANLIMTAPAIGDVAKVLRRNITWEIIVPERGVYEVQSILKRRDFYRPTEDRSRLWYDATGRFEKLPPEIDKLYKELRDKAVVETKFGEEKKVQTIFDRIRLLHEQGYPASYIAMKLNLKKRFVVQKLREMGLEPIGE